jgi:hypothetical protein
VWWAWARSHAGVAAIMFKTLAERGINRGDPTSETRFRL